MVSTVAVGLPAMSRSVAADDPLLMDVDLPPVISSGQEGTIVTAIYLHGHRGEGDVEDLEDEIINHPDFEGFKLGPERENDDFDVTVDGADHVRSRILLTGNMGVFFEVDPFAEGDWFTPEDNRAKLSAIDDQNKEIAWGFDEVTVSRDGSEARRF